MPIQEQSIDFAAASRNRSSLLSSLSLDRGFHCRKRKTRVLSNNWNGKGENYRKLSEKNYIIEILGLARLFCCALLTEMTMTCEFLCFCFLFFSFFFEFFALFSVIFILDLAILYSAWI